jgi:hypothetical protein
VTGTLGDSGRRRRRPSRRRPGWARWAAGVAVALVIFAVGIALGRALQDNPRPGITVTTTKTVVP